MLVACLWLEVLLDSLLIPAGRVVLLYRDRYGVIADSVISVGSDLAVIAFLGSRRKVYESKRLSRLEKLP